LSGSRDDEEEEVSRGERVEGRERVSGEPLPLASSVGGGRGDERWVEGGGEEEGEMAMVAATSSEVR
jgi:hypothetical protein